MGSANSRRLTHTASSASSTTSAASAAADLPGDVLPDVFLRIRAKTLSRFISVCKHWNSLIADPFFISSHLAFSSSSSKSSPPPSHLFISLHHGLSLITLYSANYDDTGTPSIHNSPTYPSPLVNASGLVHSDRLAASNIVMGYVCFFRNRVDDGENYDFFVLYNLTTRESVVMEVDGGRDVFRGHRMCALGFDPVTSRYKVVVHCVETDVYDVFDFESRLWKRMNVPQGMVRCGMSGVCLCVDGIVYWTGSAGVVAFDVSKEEFELKEYPLGVEFLRCVGLVQMGGEAGLVVTNHFSRDSTLTIYTLGRNMFGSREWIVGWGGVTRSVWPSLWNSRIHVHASFSRTWDLISDSIPWWRVDHHNPLVSDRFRLDSVVIADFGESGLSRFSSNTIFFATNGVENLLSFKREGDRCVEDLGVETAPALFGFHWHVSRFSISCVSVFFFIAFCTLIKQFHNGNVVICGVPNKLVVI